jgi:hypothetical protein
MSLEELAVVSRYDRDVFRVFAPQLSVRLGRKIDAERDFLTVYDFSNESVDLEFEDDSRMLFEYAFIVEGDEYYGVFTEHTGYHCVCKRGIVEAKIIYLGKRKKPKYLKKKEPG